jgi:hypothetical protein
MVYFGALTFDPKDPANHLKIPNQVAASRIASTILERYRFIVEGNVASPTQDSGGDALVPFLSMHTFVGAR